MTPRVPAWAWAGLAAILVLDVWLRLHPIGPSVRARLGFAPWPVVRGETEPLDCDEAAYGYMGRRMARGDVLYRDLTENKPPLGYWLYAAAVAAGGPREVAIRLLPLPIVLATIVLVWGVALRLAGPAAATVAAFLYAVASADPSLFGNLAHLEHPTNLFATAALALVIAPWGRPGRWRLWFAGAAIGAASLVRQTAGLHLPVFAVALWLRRGSGRGRDVAGLVGGFAAAWGIALAVLVGQGAGRAAFDDVVRYGGALATDTPSEPNAPPFLVRWVTGNADPGGGLPWPFGKSDYRVWWGTGTWPLWLAALPALAWLARGPAPRRLVVAWTLSAWVQVAASRLFWQHYYLLPVPGLAIAAGVMAADAARAIGSSRKRAIAGLAGWVGLVGVTLAAAAMATIQVKDYLLVPPAELVRYNGGPQWIAHRALGRELARRAPTGAGLYVWGWQSGLYFYSGLDSPTPHFFADPLLKAFAGRDHPLIRPREDRIVRDLRARPPLLIFAGDPPFPALLDLLRERYIPSRLHAQMPDGRGLWVERSRWEEFERGG